MVELQRKYSSMKYKKIHNWSVYNWLNVQNGQGKHKMLCPLGPGNGHLNSSTSFM